MVASSEFASQHCWTVGYASNQSQKVQHLPTFWLYSHYGLDIEIAILIQNLYTDGLCYVVWWKRLKIIPHHDTSDH